MSQIEAARSWKSLGEVSTSGTAAALAATQACTIGVLVQAKSDNTASVFLGEAASVTVGTGIELAPGRDKFFPLTDPALIFAVSAAAQKLRVAIFGLPGQ